MSGHKVELLNGSARLLQSMFNNFGATEPQQVFLIGMFCEENLSTLPAFPEGKPTEAELKAFSREPLIPFEINERTRDAIKGVIKTATGKGGVPGTYEAALLIKAFGLDA